MKLSTRLACWAGMLIPVWLVAGVTLAGLFYPGYSHLNQAMSELGAQAAPTYWLSPAINNYPLAMLFAAFAYAVLVSLRSLAARTTGVLLLVHGVASLVTGYFPCDMGCAPENPSNSQAIHNAAGLIMFLSLVLGSLIWVFIAKRELGSRTFALFSGLCTLVAVGSAALLGHALEAGELFGFYQRLNYGASVIWVGVLAWMLLRSQRAAAHCGSRPLRLNRV